jgi:hypothetical protein
MRLQTSLRVGAIIALTGMLAACGGDNGPSTSTSPPSTNNLSSEFGSEFATIFNASSTSIPVTPDNNAVPALAPAAQPVAMPATS